MKLEHNSIYFFSIYLCLFFLSCSKDKTVDPLDSITCAGIGTINQGEAKAVSVTYRKTKDSYKYIWMGFVENGEYRTDYRDISSVSIGNDPRTTTLWWDVPVTANIPSGLYTVYVAMGPDTSNALVRTTTEDKCVNFVGSNPQTVIDINLEFLSPSPINYIIKDNYFFKLKLKTNIKFMPPGGTWVRAYLRIGMPYDNGNIEWLESNSYVYLATEDWHWETFDLEFGGGNYEWNGDMAITAMVELYEHFPPPSGNQLKQATFDYNYPKIVLSTIIPAIQQIDIEYDQQVGLNFYDDLLDETGGYGQSKYINYAYAPALKKLAFYKDSNHQQLPLQVFNFDDIDEMLDYIDNNHSNTAQHYFCAVERILPGNSGQSYVLGIAVPEDGNIRGVLIAYDHIMNPNYLHVPFAENPQEFRGLVALWAAAHEMGHYFGIYGHEGHTMPFDIYCLMNPFYFHYYGGTWTNIWGSLYHNPHFCENHVNFLQSTNKMYATGEK